MAENLYFYLFDLSLIHVKDFTAKTSVRDNPECLLQIFVTKLFTLNGKGYQPLSL